MNPLKRTARIAGFLYLIMGMFSAFSMKYVDPKFRVPGDAAATVSNILTSGWLYRLGFVSNLIGQITFLFLVYALYELLKSVNKNQARLMVILVVASVPLACLNMLNQFAPVMLLSGSGYLSGFEPAQLHALVMAYLNLYGYGILIAGVFWGLWLFPLGYLVFKSGFMPKVIGILLIVAGAGYVFDSLGRFLVADYHITVSSYTFIGELLMIFWLLIKGVKDPKPAEIKAG